MLNVKLWQISALSLLNIGRLTSPEHTRRFMTSRLIEVTITHATDLKSAALGRSNRLYVEVESGGIRTRSATIEDNSKKNEPLRLGVRFLLPISDDASNTTFGVFRVSRVRSDKCIGKVDITMGELIQQLHRSPEQDIILALTEKKGTANSGRLAVRVTERSDSGAAAVIEAARRAERTLHTPRAIGAASSAIDPAQNQADLASGLSSLLGTINVLVKLGDEIAKIHPYVNFAWQVISVGLKIAQAQQVRDQKISELVTAMEDTCVLVSTADELKKNETLQAIVEQILKQTIECGFFIQAYARSSFGARAVKQPLSGTDEVIVGFCSEFSRLRSNFESGVNVDTGLVLSRVAQTVDMIRRDQVLSKLKPEFMDESMRSYCLPQTRLDLIAFINRWIADSSDGSKRVLWVNGLAGSGKSTLSTTIAQLMGTLHRLGAFFFFDRDKPERNGATLLRTIAYKLASFDEELGHVISRAVENNPEISGMRPEAQFVSLLSTAIFQGIEWSRGPVVLVIDALDECGADRQIILQALAKGFSDLPSFIRVVLFSRPDADIERALGLHSAVTPLRLDIETPSNNQDIIEFFCYRFAQIRDANKYLRLSHDWPGSSTVNHLKILAGGLFVWASTACLYIDSHDPQDSLAEVIHHQVSNNPNGPFANLDRLYQTGLQAAGDWSDNRFSSDCQSILGTIICARVPIPHNVIDSLLKLPRPSLQTISRLGCVLSWSETKPIRTLHPSFHDYLVQRCGDEAWSVNRDETMLELGIQCIQILNATLHENVCDLTLQGLVPIDALSADILYACKFWVEHIILSGRITANLGATIFDFLGNHLTHWLEALRILGSYRSAITSLRDLSKWVLIHFPNLVELCTLVNDAYRFVQYFSSTIEEHPLKIYTLAVPFSPPNSSIYRNFHNPNQLPVVCGVDPEWPRQLQRFNVRMRASVQCISVSYNDTHIVTGCNNGDIHVWDVETGVEIFPALHHDSDVESVSLSPNGAYIVSGSDDSTICLWDAHTGALITPKLTGHEDSVCCIAFAPDSIMFVSGSKDKTVRVWSAQTGLPLFLPFRGHGDTVTSLSFSSSGTRIVSGGEEGTFRFWDVFAGTEVLPPLQTHDANECYIALSPDESKVAANRGGEIHILDVGTLEPLHRLVRPEGVVNSIAFSPDGSKLIASIQGTLILWDTRQGVKIMHQGLGAYAFTVVWSYDGAKLYVGLADGAVGVWDAEARSEPSRSLPAGHSDYVTSWTFSPDGRTIVSGSRDTTVRIWNALTGAEKLPALRGHRDEIEQVIFSLDGTKLVSASKDTTIRIWEVLTHEESLPSLRGHESAVLSIAFSPDGMKIASGSLDKTIRVWDFNTGTVALPPLQGHSSGVSCVKFSLDGLRIISASEDNTIRIWDATTGREVIAPIHQALPYYLDQLSYDGRYIVLISKNNPHLDAVVLDATLGSAISSNDSVYRAVVNKYESKNKSEYRTSYFGDGSIFHKLTGIGYRSTPIELATYGWRTFGSRGYGWTRDGDNLLIIKLSEQQTQHL